MKKISEFLEEAKTFTDKQIKMAYGILNDPRYKKGNLTGAIDKIEKIAKGLSDHPGVKKAMKATQEKVEEATMYLVKMRDGTKHKKTMDSTAAEKLKKNPKVLSVSVIGNVAEEVEPIDEKLTVADGIAAWIKDFQDSDAPQFKGKSDKERRDMAIAAYLSAKREAKKK